MVAPGPALLQEPDGVTAVERRTATIVEPWLRPLAAELAHLPHQYVLLEDRDLTVMPRRAVLLAP